MMLSFILASMALQLASGPVATKAAVEQGERASDSADKMICKRFTQTGSLVASYRMCKTKAEWEKSRDALRQTTVSDSCRLSGQGGAC